MIEFNFAISHLELIGWLGNLLLALCALPAAILAIKRGNCDHIGVSLMIPWTAGEVFALYYALQFESVPLNMNYVANLVFLVVLWYYKIWRRK